MLADARRPRQPRLTEGFGPKEGKLSFMKLKRKTVTTLLVAGGVTLGALYVLTRVRGASGRPLLSIGGALKPGSYEFPFDDAQRLLSGQRNGGYVHVPEGATSSSPILVWLHGNNEEGVMRRGVGAPGNDLRKMVPSDVIVAAPSQTKGGKGPSLWAGFDLDAFLTAVETAIGGKVDRKNVILAGHSGAGCNGALGMIGKLDKVMPQQILFIDGCMDPGIGQKLGEVGKKTKVMVFFQRATWNRDFPGFARAFGQNGSIEEIKSFPSGYGNPHEAIVPVALQRAFGTTPVA